MIQVQVDNSIEGPTECYGPSQQWGWREPEPPVLSDVGVRGRYVHGFITTINLEKLSDDASASNFNDSDKWLIFESRPG